MLLPFRLGLGGPIGSGGQFWSWIAIDDAVGAILHALATPDLEGAVNAASPNAVTNREFARTLGRVLRRPAVLRAPAFLARLALGELARELLLASIRVRPVRLLETGYAFRHPDLDPALRHLLCGGDR
jgi:NAD dependent epimerase/dehydratase family enzyme